MSKHNLNWRLKKRRRRGLIYSLADEHTRVEKSIVNVRKMISLGMPYMKRPGDGGLLVTKVKVHPTFIHCWGWNEYIEAALPEDN